MKIALQNYGYKDLDFMRKLQIKIYKKKSQIYFRKLKSGQIYISREKILNFKFQLCLK